MSAWEILPIDAPSVADSDRMSAFLRGQTPPEAWLPEKESIHRWKLHSNEARPGFATAAVDRGDGRIVSLCTVTPKRYWNAGVEQLWAETGDTFTDSAFLRQGLFAAVVAATRDRAVSSGVRIIYGLPNENSMPGYLKKLEFKHFEGVVVERRTALLSLAPLSRPGVIGAVARNSALVALSRIAARTVLSVTLASAGDVIVGTQNLIGDEFDDLWRRAREHLPTSQVRDARYLRWRFEQSPFPFQMLAARRGGTLCGYIVVLTRSGSVGRDYAHTHVVDWLYDPALEPDVSRALLRAAVRSALDAKSDLVSVVSSHNTPIPLPVPSGLFLKRSQSPVIVFASTDGNQLIAEARPWHFTASDTDAF